MEERFISVCGVFVFLAVAVLFSRNRAAIQWRTVAWGMSMQLIFAVIVLKTSPGQAAFQWLNDKVVVLLDYQLVGAELVFGKLGIPPGQADSMGFFFAFQVLTTIVFFSALASLLYYTQVLPRIVQAIAWVMKKGMGTSGAETLSASANIFVGMVEAPLTIRPYIAKMTESELLCVMTAGMATVAGGVMGAYIGMLQGSFPNIAGHLMAASVMSAPAAIVVSKLLVPETEEPVTVDSLHSKHVDTNSNVFEATASGAETGLKIALNVGAMLVAFMSLLALLNGLLGWGGGFIGYPDITLEALVGYLFAPVAWLLGVPWGECLDVGRLIGEKTIINELVAYVRFGELLTTSPEALSERSMAITAYALCGFSNFMAIGIQIGGLGALAPERRHDVARLGLLALFGGTLACLLTAAVAGILV